MNRVFTSSCISILFFISTVLFSSSLFSQSNNPAPYCVANYTSSCAERWIASVVTVGASTNLVNASNSCGPFYDGYSYYCNHYLGATAAQAISFSVTIGGFNTYGLRVSLDWNGDNAFNVPSEVFYSITSSNSNSPHVFTITVPPTQPNGIYRLRVKMVQWGSITNTCTTEMRGETEDYDVYVGTQPPSNTNYSVSIVDNSPMCVGQTLSLSANVTGTQSVTYSWTGPASFASTNQSTVITNVTNANSGSYLLSVTSGTCPITVKKSIIVNSYPTLTLNTSSSCVGDTQTLTASGANSYSWVNGPTTPWIYVTPSVSTVYTVIGSNWGCNTTATTLATVLPEYTLSLGAPVICVGSQATLNVSGGTSYTWSTGSNSATAYDSPTTTTIYTIVVQAGSCTATGSITQVVSLCTEIGTDEMNLTGVKIYPNPFKDELKLLSTELISIRLFDITGKEILRKEVIGETTINTNHLAKGVYFIHFADQSEVKALKLIKD